MNTNLFQTEFLIIDVGAAGGIHKRWDKFKRMNVIGFDPFESAFKNVDKNKRFKWINSALYEVEGFHELNIMRSPSNTSMLEPNDQFIEKLAYKKGDFDIIDKKKVECTTLDLLVFKEDIKPVFIKLDTQGTELYILRGGKNAINETVFAAEIEVEFSPLYKNQPLFVDIHSFLNKLGFNLMDYGNILHVKNKGVAGIGGPKSNLISGDALYFLDTEKTIEKIKKDQISLDGVLAVCLAYGYTDYAIDLCKKLRKETDKNYPLDKYENQLFKHQGTLQRIINKINLSDKSIRKITALKDRLIPVKHASWFPGLGNK